MGISRQLLTPVRRLFDIGLRSFSSAAGMNIRFDGKKALVTGAGKGIGKLLAVKLAEAGATVVAVSRTQSDLDALKKEIPEKIQTLCLDIGDWEKAKKALQAISGVDMLVNNAAIMDVKEFGELGEEEVDKALNINVKGIINVTQMVTNDMKARKKGGAIVNLSSVLGLYAVPSYGVYCASKGAVHQLTRTMAAEFGPHNSDPAIVNVQGKEISIHYTREYTISVQTIAFHGMDQTFRSLYPGVHY